MRRKTYLIIIIITKILFTTVVCRSIIVGLPSNDHRLAYRYDSNLFQSMCTHYFTSLHYSKTHWRIGFPGIIASEDVSYTGSGIITYISCIDMNTHDDERESIATITSGGLLSHSVSIKLNSILPGRGYRYEMSIYVNRI